MTDSMRVMFKHKPGVCCKEHLLDIDNAMVVIDSIVSRYIPTPSSPVPVWYLRGRRYPLESRGEVDRYKNTGLIRNTPWHPHLSIPLLNNLLEYYQYRHTQYPELFITNPIKDSPIRYRISNQVNDTDIILDMIPDISEEDLYEVSNLFLDIYQTHLASVYRDAPNSIYSLCSDSNLYRLIQYEDIKAYRFEELLTAMEDTCHS